ncbi:hypothetical protein CVT26_003799 [Gymnopilus dilepis]|uniref:Uncharacterized protein n=1 Tax=Gymnopilus dilepis TaxID=231916 RepID=A0A409W1M4_9AGAR|nr:hypothetical protein CVT26_003799 [Gymnopilus dilepis]
MSTPTFKERPPIEALLIDISGTLHIGGDPTPNAVQSFQRLRDSGVDFRLCSNTSNQSTASLIKQLEKMGFNLAKSGSMDKVRKNDQRLVWTSIGVVAKVLKEMELYRPYLLLSDSAREEVLKDIQRDNHAKGPSVSEAEEYDSVVVGLAPSLFDYQHLNTAFRILKGEHKSTAILAAGAQKSPLLIAANKSRYVQKEDGLALGPGPFVAGLENASGATARVVGKPTKEFFQMVIDDLTNGVNEKFSAKKTKINRKIAVIGDDIEADLGGGALELGLWRVLVKTGKYRPGDENRPGLVPPDEVCDSLATFIDSLLRDSER